MSGPRAGAVRTGDMRGLVRVVVVPATFVIALFGLVTLVTGLAGWFVPAIRNA